MLAGNPISRCAMRFFETLMKTPGPLSPSSRYTVACGIFYLGFGILTYAWPGMAQTIFQEKPFAGNEEAMMRLVGFVVGVIGWLYIFGGRTGARSLAASTVVDRLIVPFALAPLIMAGVVPRVLITFAVLDPALALGVWLILRRET